MYILGRTIKFLGLLDRLLLLGDTLENLEFQITLCFPRGDES